MHDTACGLAVNPPSILFGMGSVPVLVEIRINEILQVPGGATLLADVCSDTYACTGLRLYLSGD